MEADSNGSVYMTKDLIPRKTAGFLDFSFPQNNIPFSFISGAGSLAEQQQLQIFGQVQICYLLSGK